MQIIPTSATSQYRTPFLKNTILLSIVFVFWSIWVYRFYNNADTLDWWLENLLVIIFTIYIVLNYRKFQFSDISYFCFFCFLMLHIYGAQYAYTQNPLGEYFQNNYQLKRNPYDRLVHTSFGLFLVYPLREILIAKFNIKSIWQYILPLEFILSLACIFELIEWAVAELTTDEIGNTYVATQGDVWDAHKDIAVAVVGAAFTMFFVYIIKKRKKKV
jgi:putative membrane protein